MTALVVVNLTLRMAVAVPQSTVPRMIAPTPIVAPLVTHVERIAPVVREISIERPVIAPAPVVTTPVRIEKAENGPPSSPEMCTRCVASVLRNALTQVGARYVHGAADPSKGFDCAGLVVYAYREGCASTLPRGSKAQFEYGTRVAKRDLRPGDLVFFRFPKVGWHVGIYIGNNEFVHAPNHKRPVSVDSLLARAYTVTFMGARRPLPDPANSAQRCAPAESLAAGGIGIPAAPIALTDSSLLR